MIPYRDERAPSVPAIGVWAIVAVNVYCFYLELTAPSLTALIDRYALIPSDLAHGVGQNAAVVHPYVVALVTSTFLHGGVAHIFFNMLFLVVFGPRMERHMGHAAFVLFYLLCGIAGGAAQTFAAPDSRVPEIGASGAIAGVMGAYIVQFPRSTIDTVTPIGCFPLFLRLPAIAVIGIWAALQFFLGFDTFDPRANQGGVAYFAHIGGFSCGVLVQGLSMLLSRRNPD